MGQTVLTCSRATINEMKQYYRTYIQDQRPQASDFFAKLPDCAITAYRSGKVLFQGHAAEEEAGRWKSTETDTAKTKETRQKPGFSLPASIQSLSVIGSDEVGTGDYFGPITVAAVFIAKDRLEEVKRIGLKDSKQLTDWQIYDLAEKIKPKVTYKLLTLHNRKYNTLRAGGMTQGKMKALLHNQALRHVIHDLEKSALSYDAILIDQFAKPEIYFKYLSGQPEIVRDRVYFRTKAESLHLSVAAASVIARQAFLHEMEKLSETAGTELPKGAGAPVDEAAARLIRKRGSAFLQSVAKVHFSNTEKAIRLAQDLGDD